MKEYDEASRENEKEVEKENRSGHRQHTDKKQDIVLKQKNYNQQGMRRVSEAAALDDTRIGAVLKEHFKEVGASAFIPSTEWQTKMNEVAHLAQIIIGKQRHGPIGNVTLEFEERFTKFKDTQIN